MDFFQIRTRLVKDKETKEEFTEIYPAFIVQRSKDLMVRGRAFYAIWDEEKQLWSTDEYDVPRLVDEALWKFRDEHYAEVPHKVRTLKDADTDQWAKFRRYVLNLSDNDHPLDEKVIFDNQEVERNDYASFKLDYAMNEGDHSAWDRIIGTLYDDEERAKLEWAIGAIINGDSRDIQKFIVLYGAPGTGKSTIMNILERIFGDYVATFDAKALGSRSNQFATSMFATNPLVAIQQDGDLSKLEDNTLINTIVSHENIAINEKNKPIYTTKINAFLFMGTNSPVKISDSRSGLIRRLIMVSPTGNLIPSTEYQTLMQKVKFEYGAIAHHCLSRYEDMGFHYYDDYRPTQMMYQTDDILAFVSDNYDIFSGQEYTTMNQAYQLYLEFCNQNGIGRPVPRKYLMQEMYSYFDTYHDRVRVGDDRLRSCFSGFHLDNIFEESEPVPESDRDNWVDLKVQESVFDKEYSSQLAQLTTSEGTPRSKWVNVNTTLADLDTSDLHYVLVPENHIIIDMDLKDDTGEKNLDLCLKEAAKFPPTYTEVSKSGGGLHLHYIYEGDVSTLANEFSPGIEIKVYTGSSSLRRKLSLCTDNPIAHISSGLPIKEQTVIKEHAIRSEKGLRLLIARNLRKEIHPGTSPSVQFIKKILDDAYNSGMVYDVTDMRSAISIFASRSSNQASACIKMVNNMKFKSEEIVVEASETENEDASLVFFDIEIYPNLFLVGYKHAGEGKTFVPMINPSSQDIEQLFRHRLVGFNNRSYDNHMLYAAYLGFTVEQLYNLSQDIIENNNHKAKFGEAYGLSYGDMYDMCTTKQSLKKWEIQLGIPYMEMDIPWNKPVPDHLIPKVIEYNKNDVLATEAVYNTQKGDVAARSILAQLSGLSMNDPTRKHAERIIFGDERNPQKQFNYVNLATGEVS